MRRGQSSLEFLVLLGFMLVVFVSFFTVAQSYLLNQQDKELQNALISISSIIEEELQLANRVNDGYARELTLPNKLIEEPYIVEVLDDQEIVVSTALYEYILFLPFNVTITSPSQQFSMKNLLVKNASGIFIIPT